MKMGDEGNGKRERDLVNLSINKKKGRGAAGRGGKRKRKGGFGKREI